MKLNDKTAIVTGSGSGIGKAIARGFAAEGAEVVIADLNEDKAKLLFDEIKKAGGAALAVKADVGYARDVANMVNATLKEFGKIDILVNNAGLILQANVVDTKEEDWDRILRNKLNYHAYIHLKIMPGAEFEQVLASMRLADRVSINLEAPNAARLPALAPKKHFENDLMRPIRYINHIRKNFIPDTAWKKRWPSSCTQFVVGAAGETDKELLSTSQSLHQDHNMLRIYFSALTPHKGTPFANHAPVPTKREHRLYQADFLIRDYGFTESELAYDKNGLLPLEKDPKLLWAECNLKYNPIEINHASREKLLRVPGIGPKGALAIIRARQVHILADLSVLKKIGVHAQRAKDFILLNGKRPVRQLMFF